MTEPLWKHQEEALARSLDAAAFALFMDPRTGKTRVVIETMAALGVEQLLVVAPNGVHRNWVTDELPRWATFKYEAVVWRSDRAKLRLPTWRSALFRRDVVTVLSVNVEALRVDACYKFCSEFLRFRPTLMVVDESQTISSPGAIQTKRALLLAPQARYRRILTGTPVTESPFQAYSQFKFLDPAILGFNTFAHFKARYGEWSQGYAPGGRTFPKLERYKNLDELSKKIARYSYRVARRDVHDVQKIYQKKYVQLTPVQRRAYEQIRDEGRAELKDRHVTSALVLTRWVRLQQITSNYWPPEVALEVHPPCAGEGCEDCGMLGYYERDVPAVQIDPEHNPRLAAAGELLEEELKAGGAAVVWCRFIHDVDNVVRLANCIDLARTVRYDGTTKAAERAEALSRFQDGLANVFVATDAAARGLRLSRATMLVYYSNGFSAEKRVQSEDRAEAIGKDTPTQVIDIVAEDTIDEVIVKAHRDKVSLAAMITGDPDKEWL